MTVFGLGGRAPNFEEQHFLDVCQRKTKCQNPSCHEFIYKGSARLAHSKMMDGHRRTLYYHVPCWMEMPCYPKGKPLSSYKGFGRLDATIQDGVLASYQGSPKDIRLNDSCTTTSPPPLTECKAPPKQCLATKSDGTRCHIKTNSSIRGAREAAKPMLEEGVWYCEHHKHVEIDLALVEEAEKERNDIFARDRQHLELSKKRSPQKKRKLFHKLVSP